MPKYWEEYNIGDKFKSPGRTITQAAIDIMLGFTGYTFSFFWDDEQAKRTLFGGRIAPGPLTLFLMCGLNEQTGGFNDETMMAMLGIDKVRFKAPLRAGDTITVETEIVGKKETKNPDRGILVHKSVCQNQKGEEILEAEITHLVRRRS